MSLSHQSVFYMYLFIVDSISYFFLYYTAYALRVTTMTIIITMLTEHFRQKTKNEQKEACYLTSSRIPGRV